MSNKKSIADEFADYTWMPMATWMRWQGWAGWVGCENCLENTDKSRCWGSAMCHGYYNGCGCVNCCEADKTIKPTYRALMYRNGYRSATLPRELR